LSLVINYDIIVSEFRNSDTNKKHEPEGQVRMSLSMPITKSAKKALRQNLRRKKRNLATENKIKNLVKKVKKLISAKKIEEAKKLLPIIYKTLDKAAKLGIIKKNTADRKKSRISKLLNRKFEN